MPSVLPIFNMPVPPLWRRMMRAVHLRFVRRASYWCLMIFMKQNSPPGRAGGAYQFFGGLGAGERLRLDGQ